MNFSISGYQRVSWGPVRQFEIMTSDFIQILHTGHHHWVCVSSIGCEPGVVHLYDSLFSGVIDNDVKEQVICLFGEKDVKVVNVQQQTNMYDCGIFAIAFATCLACNILPETVHLDVALLRPHLKRCLKSGQMEPFPILN